MILCVPFGGISFVASYTQIPSKGVLPTSFVVLSLCNLQLVSAPQALIGQATRVVNMCNCGSSTYLATECKSMFRNTSSSEKVSGVDSRTHARNSGLRELRIGSLPDWIRSKDRYKLTVMSPGREKVERSAGNE